MCVIVSKEIHNLAEQLQKARVDDDYVETDLRTWTAMLQKLKDDVDIFSPSICIQEDATQILVSRMYLSTVKQHLEQTEKFGNSFGDVRIEENGLLATHCGRENGTAFVLGIGEYSSGTHKIRFLFKKSSSTYVTSFKVVSKLMPIAGAKPKLLYKGYGWDSKDFCISDFDWKWRVKNFQDMRGQTTFEIEFQLDCDNRKISYTNQRTKNRRELNIDITKCPFPWQVSFYLYETGDCVRFLP